MAAATTGRGTGHPFVEALMRPLGHRLRAAALDFASWAPAAGVSLLAMTLAAVALTNTALGAQFTAFWERALGLSFGERDVRAATHRLDQPRASVRVLPGRRARDQARVHRRSSGESSRCGIADCGGHRRHGDSRLLYALLIPAGGWSHGWGVPMATDTAFAVALIAMMGRRVPIELRIFLTAATIVDDIGAITVVALFYSAKLTSGIWRPRLAASPYWRFSIIRAFIESRLTSSLGVALWAFVHAGGVHATLAGVLLALFIPTRPPPNLEFADGAGERHHCRRGAARRRGSCVTALHCRRFARLTLSMTGLSRRPPGPCATSRQVRASWCCPCSRLRTPA